MAVKSCFSEYKFVIRCVKQVAVFNFIMSDINGTNRLALLTRHLSRISFATQPVFQLDI